MAPKVILRKKATIDQERILKLKAEGKTHEQVAEEVDCSVRTVVLAVRKAKEASCPAHS